LEPEKENPQSVDILADETELGAGDAAALPRRLNRYSQAHHRALEMSHYATSKGEVKIAKQLHDCGAWLVFRDYYTQDTVRLRSANFCRRHLLCPLCAIRRGAKSLEQYLAKVQLLQQQNPNLKAYMVTLTVKDGADLEERFNHLHRSVQKLHKARGRERQYNESCKASAAVWSYEFKRGQNSGEWHPHVHAVWMCEEAPDYVQLRHQWHKITGDSKVVHVQPFYNQDQLVEGFLEVFKYAVKFSDLPLEDNWHGFEILKGRRLISSFGDFYGMDMPHDLTDAQLDGAPFMELLYKFVQGAGYSFEGFLQHKPQGETVKAGQNRQPINWRAHFIEAGIARFERMHLSHRKGKP
jgi:hypothetical protein